MARQFLPADRDEYCAMAQSFFSSDAVEHKIGREHFENTFAAIIAGTPSLKGYIIEQNGAPAGYGTALLSYSNELGGLLAGWDEIYIKPQYRGRGLGTAFIEQMEREFRDTVRGYRLEVENENAGAMALYRRLGYKLLRYRQMTKFVAQTPKKELTAARVRPFASGDREGFLAMAAALQASGIIEMPAGREKLAASFDTALSGSPHLDGWILTENGKTAGYVLINFFYSNESNGMQANIDEIFVRPEYRKRGLFGEFLDFYEQHYHDGYRVWRIETLDSDARTEKFLAARGYVLLEYLQMIKLPE